MDAPLRTYLPADEHRRRNGVLPVYLVLYLAASAVLTVSYFISPMLSAWLATAFVSAYVMLNTEDGTFFWIALSYFVYILSTTCFAIISLVLLFKLLARLVLQGRRLSFSYVTAMVAATAVILISTRLGVHSNTISALMTISNVVLYFLLLSNYDSPRYIERVIEAFWVMAFLFIGITLLDIVRNGIDLRERLDFEDNVRDMANSIVVAVYFWICLKIKKQYETSFGRSFRNLVGVLSSGLLLLTLAKGPIFALVFAVALYGILEKKIRKVGYFLIVMLAIIGILQVTGTVNFMRFLQRNYDLNGRTNIWLFYARKVFARGWKGILFGLGPGNVKRVAVGEYLGKYYAHSAVIDFFFSYGIVGMTMFVALVASIARKAFRAKNSIGLGLLSLSLLSYMVSGASTNTQIFILFFFTHLTTTGELERSRLTEQTDAVGAPADRKDEKVLQ